MLRGEGRNATCGQSLACLMRLLSNRQHVADNIPMCVHWQRSKSQLLPICCNMHPPRPYTAANNGHRRHAVETLPLLPLSPQPRILLQAPLCKSTEIIALSLPSGACCCCCQCNCRRCCAFRLLRHHYCSSGSELGPPAASPPPSPSIIADMSIAL